MMRLYVSGVIIVTLVLSFTQVIQAQSDVQAPTSSPTADNITLTPTTDTIMSSPTADNITLTPTTDTIMSSPTTDAVNSMQDSFNQITSTGNPADLVDVIIELHSKYGLENPSLSRTTIRERRAQIRSIQNEFINRQTINIQTVKRKSNIFPIIYVTIRRGDINTLASDPLIVSINIDQYYAPTMFGSTELIGSQLANQSGYDGKGTSVVVLDTGVNKSHPFLSTKVVGEACFSTTNYMSTSLCPNQLPQSTAKNSGKPCPQNVEGCNHGTHVAGTIAGKITTIQTKYNGTKTVRGVAPGAKIIAVQVFSRFAKNYCGNGATSDCTLTWTSDFDAALEWIYEKISAGNVPAYLYTPAEQQCGFFRRSRA